MISLDEKIFGNAMFGFDKNDVNTYIEKMVKDFENNIREKDEEITLLKVQNKDLKKKYEEVSARKENSSQDKDKIIDVLLRAQENAERIIKDAKEQGRVEKEKLEKELNSEKQRIFEQLRKDKQKIVDVRQQLNALKKQAKIVVENFEQDLDSVQDLDFEIEGESKKTDEPLNSNYVRDNETSVSNMKNLDNVVKEFFLSQDTNQINQQKDKIAAGDKYESKQRPNELIEKIDELNNSMAGVKWSNNRVNK